MLQVSYRSFNHEAGVLVFLLTQEGVSFEMLPAFHNLPAKCGLISCLNKKEKLRFVRANAGRKCENR